STNTYSTRTRTACPTWSRSTSRTSAASSARTSSPRGAARGTSSMRRSIRGRLQVWYALVLLAVGAGVAGIPYYQARAARFQEIDAALESAAAYLDANLRRFPPYELQSDSPDKWPPKKKPKDPPDGRPHLTRERLLADLHLPLRAEVPGESDRSSGMYFA